MNLIESRRLSIVRPAEIVRAPNNPRRVPIAGYRGIAIIDSTSESSFDPFASVSQVSAPGDRMSVGQRRLNNNNVSTTPFNEDEKVTWSLD